MTSQRSFVGRDLPRWAAAGLAAGSAAVALAALTSGSKETPAPEEPDETLILRSPLLANGATLEPKTTPTHTRIPSPLSSGLRYLALGDSYTIGEKVTDSERFPAQLTRRLRAKNIEIRNPVIVARTGWTTGELCKALAADRPQGTFDLVTLLIGVNNQYRGLGLEEYRCDFAALADQAVDLAWGETGRVIVISIPDWGGMPYARSFNRALIAEQIDAFNQVNRALALEKGVRYVNITPLTRKVGEDTALVAGDGLHPSGKQYAQWVDLLLPESLAALGS